MELIIVGESPENNPRIPSVCAIYRNACRVPLNLNGVATHIVQLDLRQHAATWDFENRDFKPVRRADFFLHAHRHCSSYTEAHRLISDENDLGTQTYHVGYTSFRTIQIVRFRGSQTNLGLEAHFCNIERCHKDR